MSSKVAASHMDTRQEQTYTNSVCENESTPLLLVESRGSVGGTIILTILCGIFAVGLVCGIYLILREDGNLDPPLNALVLQLVTRDEWAANETDINQEHLNFPADNVLLLQSNGPTCYNKRNCLNEMHMLQTLYLNHTNKSGFIANFMIGGDGRTYEGCGWTCKANYGTGNNTLVVGLIGTFQDRPPTELQITQIVVLVDYAIAEKKLLECHAVSVQPEPGSKITFLTAVAEVLQKRALCDKN